MPKFVKVKTVEGRIARQSPRGPEIPHEHAVRVEHTPYIERLLNVHKDIVLADDPENPPPRSKAKAPVATESND